MRDDIMYHILVKDSCSIHFSKKIEWCMQYKLLGNILQSE